MKGLIAKAVGVFIGLAGLVVVVVQLITTPGRLGSWSLFFLSAVALILGLWIVSYNPWRGRRAARALPPIAQLEDICIGYHISPATPEEIDWIARQEESVYVSGDAVPKMF